jgi:hypothetical protein
MSRTNQCRELVERESAGSQSVDWRVSELDDHWGSVVMDCYCEKLVAEAVDSPGTQRMGNVRRWKPVSRNG